MWRALAFSLTLMVVLAPAAFAQHKFEISPFGGLRTAGSFRGEGQLVSYNVQTAPTFGVFADFMVTRQLALEFLWGHEGSTVDKKTAVLGEDSPTPPIEPEVPDGELFDLGVDYFHGGVRYDGGNEKYTPYVAGGLGVTRFNPDAAMASGVTKFSFSLGAGINAYLTEHIGVRFDARAFGTRTGDSQEDIACGVFGCVTFKRASTFWQSHFVGALIIRF
ncbi:MAG: hypothetical protein BMS9Abin37_0761 [Acidobacteriota bacterium]|nr:MAG: hypothetical protein BMS9Abin37_0761 [Acidobacteriota bacterium]